MPETTPIALLRQVIQHARRGQPLPPDAAGWLVAGAQRYEAAATAGDAIGLDVALGLGVPGRHGWWTLEARGRRDGLLRDLRAKRFADVDDAEAARRILTMFRARVRDPLLTEALCTGLAMPAYRQLKAILRKSAAVGVFHGVISSDVP